MKAAELYETDFAEWAVHNAQLLRSGRIADADLEHIAEEIEDMARSLRRGVRNRLTHLMQHLLKWQIQPIKRSPSWRRTITEQRFRIKELLQENLSFRPELQNWITEVHEYAVRLASIDTGLDQGSFPRSWPYTVEQTLDQNFLPE
jgi:hypothetical protein